MELILSLIHLHNYDVYVKLQLLNLNRVDHFYGFVSNTKDLCFIVFLSTKISYKGL